MSNIVWSRVLPILLIISAILMVIYYMPSHQQPQDNTSSTFKPATPQLTNKTSNETKLANETLNKTETPPKNESLNLDELSTDVFGTINNYRAEEGVGQVAWNDTIAAAAKAYGNNTLLYGKSTNINGTLDYSIVDVITYTLYLYESCSYNSTGSLQHCTYLKHSDALSQIGNKRLNTAGTREKLTLKNFTDGGVGVVVNGSYAYITIILTDTQAWEKLKPLIGESSNRQFAYVLRGNRGKISMTVYSGLKNMLAGLSRYYSCNPGCPSDAQKQLYFLDQQEQKSYLEVLANEIKSRSFNKDNQARIAISLVQNIPYDWQGDATNHLTERYPYEVIYDGKGVCGEKSRLLAFLLRDLGYGVVLLNYAQENHMAVGIKCPTNYSNYIYNNTGYCFIETTTPAIVTDNQSDYAGIGKLRSTPGILPMNDGNSFGSVSEEYNDAQQLHKLLAGGQVLDQYNRSIWQSLADKYGI